MKYDWLAFYTPFNARDEGVQMIAPIDIKER
jgi:hypothetical protein